MSVSGVRNLGGLTQQVRNQGLQEGHYDSASLFERLQESVERHHRPSQCVLLSVKIVLGVGRGSFLVKNRHKYDISYLLCHSHLSL